METRFVNLSVCMWIVNHSCLCVNVHSQNAVCLTLNDSFVRHTVSVFFYHLIHNFNIVYFKFSLFWCRGTKCWESLRNDVIEAITGDTKYNGLSVCINIWDFCTVQLLGNAKHLHYIAEVDRLKARFWAVIDVTPHVMWYWQLIGLVYPKMKILFIIYSHLLQMAFFLSSVVHKWRYFEACW